MRRAHVCGSPYCSDPCCSFVHFGSIDMRVLGRNLAPGDIMLSNRNPQYLQPSGRNPFPLAQRRTLRSVDLPQGAIVQSPGGSLS